MRGVGACFSKVIVSFNDAVKIAAIKIVPEDTWSGSPLRQFWRKLKMKNRTIFAVLLAVILAVPVFAQDNSAPMNQPATSQASSSQTAAQATATGKDPLQPETREGFWGHMNPFARKKYVARQTQPIRDRVNELDELTASNTRAIRDTDARAQAGILLASNKANEALDEMATPLKDQRGYVVEVQGFSSGRGQAAIASSQKMAESVVRYLVLNHDIPVYRIYLVGMGNAPASTSTGEAKPKRIIGGRVEVSLLKNNLEQLASTTTTSTQDQQQK